MGEESSTWQPSCSWHYKWVNSWESSVSIKAAAVRGKVGDGWVVRWGGRLGWGGVGGESPTSCTWQHE